MKLDLNEVVGTHVCETGVLPVTKGMIITAQMRDGLREFLKEADPEGYAEYREIRYPEGEGSDTDETRRASIRFVFTRAGEIAATHYATR